MKNTMKSLLVRQLDRKLQKLRPLGLVEVPSKGWINAIRTSLNMTLSQLGKRLGKTRVTIQEIEEREQNKSITLNKLEEVGNALGLRLVYGFVPMGSSLESIIDERATKIAKEIVMRASHTMMLEDQATSPEFQKREIERQTMLLKEEMPKYLWD